MIRLILSLVFAAIVSAQVPWIFVTSLPGLCRVGESYFVTTAAPGSQLFYCSSPNTYTAVGSGGGGGTYTAGPSGMLTITGSVIDGDTAYIPGKTVLNDWLGPNNFGGATSTIPFKVGTSDPATCNVGEHLYRSDLFTIKVCAVVNVWSTLSAPMGSAFMVEDEFCGQVEQFALNWVRTGTAVDTSQNIGSFSHPCVANVFNSGAANNVAGLALRFDGSAGGANWGLLDGWAANTGQEFVFIFRVGGITEIKYRVGLADGGVTQAAPANGIYAEFSNNTGCTTTGSDTTWVYNTRASSTSSTANGPTVSTNTWIKLRIRSTTAGTWRFSVSVDGGAYSSEQTLSTNVPTGKLAPFFATVGCTSGTYYTFPDYFGARVTGLTR